MFGWGMVIGGGAIGVRAYGRQAISVVSEWLNRPPQPQVVYDQHPILQYLPQAAPASEEIQPAAAPQFFATYDSRSIDHHQDESRPAEQERARNNRRTDEHPVQKNEPFWFAGLMQQNQQHENRKPEKRQR
jgi:hypothetical protein